MFDSISAIRASLLTLPDGDRQAREAAIHRDAQLTKPPGALAQLEQCVQHLAAWQRKERPRLDDVAILVFAGNHGVAARGVSAFPADVTAQMVANFTAGGAAINQLAKLHGASLAVIPIDLARPTADFTAAPAMSDDEFLSAVNAGANAVPASADLVILGEMGIGNTTAAAAVAAALYGGDAMAWVGPGTGVSGATLLNKIKVVDAGLALHGAELSDPLGALRCLGGRELAAMFGAALQARLASIPLLLDGFVVCASVAALERLVPGGLDHALAGHVSAEPGHRRLLSAVGKIPLLDIGMRLGEGSGAAVALGILKAAVACHAGMATFSEANVSGRSGK